MEYTPNNNLTVNINSVFNVKTIYNHSFIYQYNYNHLFPMGRFSMLSCAISIARMNHVEIIILTSYFFKAIVIHGTLRSNPNFPVLH
jgi:hypothetical protein